MHLSQFRKHIPSTVKAAFLLVALLLLFEVAVRLYRELNNLLTPLNLPFLLGGLLSAVALFIAINIPLMLAEKFSPGLIYKRNYLKGAKYWLVFLVVTYYWSVVAGHIYTQLHIVPLFTWTIHNKLDSFAGVMIIGAGILLPLLVFDFFYYWFHRAQHQFPVLWRFHKVHHSLTELNCMSSYHHVTEEVFRFPVVGIPLALLLKVDVPQMVILSAFVAAWGQFIHSDTSISLGKLNLFFADNVYHRVHHSVEERHFDKNFAAFFPLWDRLFGTFYKPERVKFPSVGLSDTPPPKSAIEYVLMPFKRTRRSVIQNRGS
jgi:sterol desaturase/sphingolipid hydroxylase (fatty acid hydroxylase superfamily)